MDIVYVKKSYEKLHDDDNCECKKIQVGENVQISEMILNAKHMDEILKLKNKYLELKKNRDKLKSNKRYILAISEIIKIYINKQVLSFKLKLFSYHIKKVCHKNNLDNSKYILANSIEKDENTKQIVKNALQRLDNMLEEYRYSGQYDKNLPKYVEKHMVSKKIDKKNIKIGIVYCKKSKVDKNILMSLLEEYKVVDILEVSKNISSEGKNKEIVEKINQQTGASVNIVDINNKKAKEYNYIIIMDAKSLNEYSKGLNRKAGKISILNTNDDILNTNIETVNTMIKEGKLDKNTVDRLRQDYGLVTFSKSLVDACRRVDNI